MQNAHRQNVCEWLPVGNFVALYCKLCHMVLNVPKGGTEAVIIEQHFNGPLNHTLNASTKVMCTKFRQQLSTPKVTKADVLITLF